MKTLSIRQPWAWCILYAGKDVENRTWYTDVRGRILIHASGGMTRREWEEAKLLAHRIHPNSMFPTMAMLSRGGIVGEVEIVDCVSQSKSPWFFGPWGFMLKNPKPRQFIPWTGRLGFFDAPE